MEVILRQDIDSLGKTGDLVKVKAGYARNYLLPKGLAFEATDGNRKRIAAESRARTARQSAERAEAASLAAKLNGVRVTLTGKAGEGDRLFGSITAQDIADALDRQGFSIDRRKIDLEHPIKSLGAHRVTIRIHLDVSAEVQVSVVQE